MKATAAFAVLAVGLCTLTHAGQVTLNDGSTLTGQIWLSEGMLLIGTEDGTVETAAKEAVTSITSDEPLVVDLASGDRLVGPVSFDAPTGRMKVASKLGELPVALADVNAIRQQGMEAPPAPKAPKEPQPKPKDGEPAEDAGFPPPQLSELIEKQGELALWTFHIDLGIAGETGNTEKFNFSANAEAKRDTDVDLLRIWYTGRLEIEDSRNTTNEHIVGTRYDRDLNEDWFVFGRGSAEHDQFEDLKIRAKATAGVGYHVIRKEDHNMKVAVGAGYLYEDFYTASDEQGPIAQVSLNYDIQINEWLKYVHETNVFPLLDDLGELRLDMFNGIEIPLAKDTGWSVRIGVRTDYTTQPAPGNKRLDNYYYINLGLDF